MDPKITLKRSSSIDYNVCLICQINKPGYKLRQAGEQGIYSVRNASLSRRQLHNTNNYDVIDRIDNIPATTQPLWHKTCFSDFTDKGKIRRLRKSYEKLSQNEASTSEIPPGHTLRRESNPVDWNMCIFCQTVKPKARLVSVETHNMSKQILDAAKLDKVVSVRVAGVSCLIAAEGKYHLVCLSAFKRRTSKTKEETEHRDVAMVWLTNELRYAAKQGQVIQLDDVWERYVKLSEDSSNIIPQSYHSRRSTFTDKLRSNLGDEFLFLHPLEVAASERGTLLISKEFGHTAMLGMATNDEATYDEMLTMPHYTPDTDNTLSLIHIALQLRSDILKAKGHTGFSVSVGDAIQCLPESLATFLMVLYCGQDALEDDCDDTTEDRVRRLFVSVVQDMVYGINGGTKMTQNT